MTSDKIEWIIAYNGEKIRIKIGNVVIEPKNKNLSNPEIFKMGSEFLENFKIIEKNHVIEEKEIPLKKGVIINPNEAGELLDRVNKTPIYSNTVDIILQKAPDLFTVFEIINILKEIYPNLKEGTLDVYARSYTKYFLQTKKVFEGKKIKGIKYYTRTKIIPEINIDYLEKTAEIEQEVKKGILN